MKKLKILVITFALLSLITFNAGVAAERDCLNPKNYAEKLLCKKDQVKNKIFKSKKSKSKKITAMNKIAQNATTEGLIKSKKLPEVGKSIWKKFKDATKGIREFGGKNIGESG